MMKTCTLEQARAAKLKAVAAFRSLVPMPSVGLTRIENGYGLKVNLERASGSPLPTEVDGVPVRIEIVGKTKKRQVG